MRPSHPDSSRYPSPAEATDCLVNHPSEVNALLQEFASQRVLVTLTAPCGASYTTLLREVDARRGALRFEADAQAPLARLLAAKEVLAIGYLDRIRVQFDLAGLAMASGDGEGRSLSCALPAGLWRFQRRGGYRVRPLPGTPATARFPLPRQPGRASVMALRVIDVSIGGVGLLLPEPLTDLVPDVRLAPVEIELDADTRFDCGLRVLHASGLSGDSPALHLGCEFTNITDASSRALQRFIDRTQRQRRLLERALD